MTPLSFRTSENNFSLNAAQARIQITACLPGCIRIRYSTKPEFEPHQSLMVQFEPQQLPLLSVTENLESFTVSTPDLSIQIDKQTLAFTYTDSDGKLLVKEPDSGGKTLEAVETAVNIFDADAEIQMEHTPDGDKIRALSPSKIIKKPAYHAKLEFEWAEGEGLYGLGSHEDGMFNLRGQCQYLYQQNMKIFIPVLISTQGYGLVFDQYSSMTFHDDAFGSYLWMDLVDELDYYFIYGPEFDQIIATIRTLTGTSPMLPKWAFGYIQSKERYASQQELLDIVKEYRERRLPLDGIVLDWKSWPDNLWGQKSLAADRFPDPQQMTQDIHALNAHLMVSIWPNMAPGGENWQEMLQSGFLLGNRSTYDALNPEARKRYWKQAQEGLFSHGIDAWWCDCTEPFEADWRGAVKPEPEERMRINVGEAKTYLDPLWINAYSLLHSQGIYEGQRNSGSTKRVVNLTRSSYLGQQRYATVVWSGDVVAKWTVLRKQIAEGMNYCVTGMPYWTVDIGAFFVQKRPEHWFWDGDYERGVDDLGYRELYVRWFQFGAFLPMFRPHGTDTPREIWRFGQPGEAMYEALVSMLRLRYQLIPYIYSLAGWVTQCHYTMIRMLPFDFRDDPKTYEVDDQFMLGPSLLVSPVTHSMYYGVNSTPLENVEKTRSVYLPSGSDWYDFWTGKRYAGGQTISADAPLETIPVHVRSGSIFPIGPQIQFTGDQPDAPIELWLYPGQDGDFTLYEDEGDNYNYEQGNFAMIHMTWNDSARQLTLDNRQGSYPGMQASKAFRLIIADGKPFGPLVKEAQAHDIFYDGKKMVVDL
jgi:alpha-D-xyloside xylohydrolase